MLSAEQVQHYERDGYLVLRSQFDESELQRFDRAFQRNPPLHDDKQQSRYPEPGRYTLAKSSLADPELAFMAEHRNIVEPASQLLGDEIVLIFELQDGMAGAINPFVEKRSDRSLQDFRRRGQEIVGRCGLEGLSTKEVG